jgi:hypothetical protein
MRKFCFLLTALLLTAQALAGGVTISCQQVGDPEDGIVEVSYIADDDANIPRAFGLDITLDNAETITAIIDANEKYWVYPGTIQIVDGVVTDEGEPVAPGGYKTAKGGIDTNGMTIEMGSLYAEEDDQGHTEGPPDAGVLLTFSVSGSCQVKIEGNAARGNVVLEDTSEAGTNLPTTCDVVITVDCFVVGNADGCGHVITQADYDMWVSLSKPDCWCYPCHCRGDADNTCTITSPDIMNTRNAWPGAPVYGTYNACADIDYTGTITSPDIMAIRNAWPGAPVNGPGCSGVTGCP